MLISQPCEKESKRPLVIVEGRGGESSLISQRHQEIGEQIRPRNDGRGRLRVPMQIPQPCGRVEDGGGACDNAPICCTERRS